VPDEELVDIVLLDHGPRPIAIYQVVHRFTGLNIKQVRKLVDAPPQVILSRVPAVQAQALRSEMEALGATFELRASGAPGAPTDLIR
jgi:ribosomal protein L7/L12